MKSRISIIWIQYGISLLLIVFLVCIAINTSRKTLVASKPDKGVELRDVSLTLFKNNKQSATKIKSDRATLETGINNTVQFSGNIHVKTATFEINPAGVFYNRDLKECVISGLPSFKEKKFHIKGLVLKDKSDALIFNDVKLTGEIPMKNTRSFEFVEANKMMGDRSVMKLMSYFADQTLKEVADKGNKGKIIKKNLLSPFTLTSDLVKLNITVFYARTSLTEISFKNAMIKITARVGQLKDSPARIIFKKGGEFFHKGVRQQFAEASLNLEAGVFTIPKRMSFKIIK